MVKSNPVSIGIANVIKGKRVRKQLPVLVSDMAWLAKDKEEAFCILVADGLPLAIAFKRAGFTAKTNSAILLFREQRIQDRISAIIKARANSPPVSLPEITDMMKRVYVGAIHDSEYTPAYNAAFGLARLYGLVVDRAQLDVVRRPSREPDAPSELALGSWIEALPSGPPPKPVEAPLSARSPPPIGPGPSSSPIIEASTYGSDLDGPARAAQGPSIIENGAPARPVTGTPTPRAHSSPDAAPDEGTGIFSGEATEPEKIGLLSTVPRAEDLF